MKTKMPNKIKLDITCGQLVITLFIFGLTFLLPAGLYRNLYDEIKSPKLATTTSTGKVAGLYTENYYIQQSRNIKSNLPVIQKPVSINAARFSFMDLVSVATVVSASFLSIFLFYDWNERRKYSSAEL